MAIAQITAVRANDAYKRLLSYISNKLQKGWFAERLNKPGSDELATTVEAMDIASTAHYDAQHRSEHSEMYALQRDQTYMTRSRKWLYTRAMQTKMDHAYEAVATFGRQNSENEALAEIIQSEPDKLENISFKELLK
jgi:hypothetical protein